MTKYGISYPGFGVLPLQVAVVAREVCVAAPVLVVLLVGAAVGGKQLLLAHLFQLCWDGRPAPLHLALRHVQVRL